MIGKYKRTGWQRRKASIKMKKIWASRRKSAAMKAWHENNAKKGGVHPVWKTPYRKVSKTPMTGTTVLETLFGPNVSFKDLTTEQRRQYWATTNKRRKTTPTLVKKSCPQFVPVNPISAIKPLEILLKVQLVRDVNGNFVIALAPSQRP